MADLLNRPEFLKTSIYAEDALFRPSSPGNFASYLLLSRDSTFTYKLNQNGPCGYVYTNDDVDHPSILGVVPVLHVEFKDSTIKGYKRARHLRIRRSFAHQGAAAGFYATFAERFGGVILDLETIERGETAWKALMAAAAERGLSVSLVESASGQWTQAGAEPPETPLPSAASPTSGPLIVLEGGASS
jgi:hypothetical protein